MKPHVWTMQWGVKYEWWMGLGEISGHFTLSDIQSGVPQLCLLLSKPYEELL